MLFKIISSRPQFLLKFLFVNKCRNTHRCVCIDHLCNVFQQIYYSYFFQNSNYNVHSIDMIRIQQMNATIYFRICIWMLMQNDTSNSLVKYNILINVETMFPSHIYDTSNEMQNMGLFFGFFYYAYNDECFLKILIFRRRQLYSMKYKSQSSIQMDYIIHSISMMQPSVFKSHIINGRMAWSWLSSVMILLFP